MPDFPDPGVFYTSPGFNAVAAGAGGLDLRVMTGSGAAAGAAWPANNRAIYMPFFVERVVTAVKMSIEVAVQAGNLDVGIYDENFARLVSSGSTAVGAVGLQVVDITDTVLTPGLYYMAMNCSTTSAGFFRLGPSSSVINTLTGHRMQDVGAIALPNPATPATPSSPYIPCLAIALQAVH